MSLWAETSFPDSMLSSIVPIGDEVAVHEETGLPVPFRVIEWFVNRSIQRSRVISTSSHLCHKENRSSI